MTKEKIDNILEDYFHKKIDLIEVRNKFIDLVENKTKELQERVDGMELQLSNEQKRVELLRKDSDRNDEIIKQLQAKIDELEKANEWISVDKKTPFTYLSGTWDGLMSDEILVKDDKGIINVARCYTGIMDGHSFVDFYDNRDFELKNIIQWKKITN